jgi:hypothetical protein
VPHEAGAVDAAAVAEKLLEQLRLADGAELELDPRGRVLGGEQLVKREVEEGRHVAVKGVDDDRVLFFGLVDGGDDVLVVVR